MTLLIRDISANEISEQQIERFTWLFASTLSSENVQQLAYTSSVDSVAVSWGLLVTINTMFASDAEAHAAVQKFFNSNPSFKQQVAKELNLRVVHYGKAITPAEREFKAPIGQTVSAPATFEIEAVDMNLNMVMDTTSARNKGLQYLSVSFTPDANFVAPVSSQFLAAKSVRIGSGTSIEDVTFTSVCSLFLNDAAAQAHFERILSQTCAPADISICDTSVSDLSSAIVFYVPLLDGAYGMDDETLFIQFEVSMQDPDSGIVFTSPLGASLSLSSSQHDSYCPNTSFLQDEEVESIPVPAETGSPQEPEPSTTADESSNGTEEPEPSTTADESSNGTEEPEPSTTADESSNGSGSVGVAASYVAEAEILTPDKAGDEGSPEQPMPTMAVGSGAAVLVVVLASGAGVVMVRRKKQKRCAGMEEGPSSSVWLEGLQAQVTSDFALGPAGADQRHPKEYGAGDLDVRGAEHLSQRLTRAAMSERLCGTAETSGMVSAVLCVDDGKSPQSTGARTVDSEAVVAGAGGAERSLAVRVISATLLVDDGDAGAQSVVPDRKRRLSAAAMV